MKVLADLIICQRRKPLDPGQYYTVLEKRLSDNVLYSKTLTKLPRHLHSLPNPIKRWIKVI